MHRIIYILFLSVLFISLSSITKGQDMRGEFKKQLRETLLHPEMKHSEQRHHTAKRSFQEKNDEVLTVSPTTVLPTRLTRLLNIDKLKFEQHNISIGVTNAESFKIKPTRSGGGDFDPLRAIYRYKARRRQEKVDKILKAYGME